MSEPVTTYTIDTGRTVYQTTSAQTAAREAKTGATVTAVTNE